jgi:leucine dehydrogenase
MTVFDNTAFDDHELVTFARDPESGLSAILALHNTSRGPALGGCRMWPYASTHAAVTDALRLARGMTYKAAISGLSFGGGKSVIIGDPASEKTPELLQAMGRAVDALGGRYTVAEDGGIGVDDVAQMARATDRVAGMPVGDSDGDPSPATAYGVYQGIRAAVRHSLGRTDLGDLRIGVQGAGAVGDKLCAYLAAEGAHVLVADIDSELANAVAAKHGAHTCPAEDILAADVDVLAPCALGGIIDDVSLPRIRARIIAGAANNQLAADHHGPALRDRGILYAPDYVVNAGGVIHISHEGPDYDRTRAFAHVGRIYDTLMEIFERAGRTGEPTAVAADRLAEAAFTHPNPHPFRAAR